MSMADKSQGFSRRSLIQGTAAAGLALAGGAAAEAQLRRPRVVVGAASSAVKTYTNKEFYDASGKFLVEKAKAAYFAMMERFHYPIPDKLRKEMWVLDFGLNDFVHVGMAGIFWLNRKDYGYFGHEIFLLPGQQIAEHAHVATDEGPAKMESWHVRHGMIYTFGEGEETKPLPVKPPESQEKIRTVKHCEPLMPGELRDLNRLEAKHFMLAGPEGAIVTEYATFHDSKGLRYSNPNAKL
jgi:D-lyxose ketol-isomerase